MRRPNESKGLFSGSWSIGRWRISVGVAAIMLVLLVGVVIFVLWMILFRHAKQDKTLKVVEQSEDTRSLNDQLPPLKDGQRSAVCDRLSTQKIETIIKQKTDGPRVSIPNTVSREESVSACTFLITSSENSPISNIIITTRNYRDSQRTVEIFDTLAKSYKTTALSSSTTYFYVDSSQMVVRAQNSISTIIINRTNNGSAFDQTVFPQIAQLLE